MIKLGFTGTREGLTDSQKERLKKALLHFNPAEVHHGDCVGADADCHQLVNDLLPFSRVVIHPPTDHHLRARCPGDEYRDCKPFLERNYDIVKECDVLIACPKELKEVLRSGTWSTVRDLQDLLKRGEKKQGFIIFPDGEVKLIR